MMLMMIGRRSVGLLPLQIEVGHRVSTKGWISGGGGGATVSDAELDYSRAKPFSEIPGPRGLPYVGTLLQFKRGTLDHLSAQ